MVGIGKTNWLSVDPMATQFPHQSPYVFTDNNPIMLWDPTGMSAEDPNGNGLVGQTTFNGITISFDPTSNKSSEDGSDVINQRLMRGTRFEKENGDGTKSMFYKEERIERTASVDIDGNVSSINETYEIKVFDENGKPVSSYVGSTNYEMNAKDDDGFSAVVGAVQVHRNKYKKAVVPHALKNISNAATAVQDLDFLAAPLYVGCIPCGVVATGVVGSAWLTNKMIDFGFISAKDIKLEIGYMEQKGRAWKGSRKVPFAW